MLPVLRRGLALRQRSMVGWALGSAAFTAMVVAIFPVVRDDPTFDELLAEYPDPVLALVGDAALNTGGGFLSAELYSLMLPVVVAILSVMTAASALAGEDERGWLALVLSGPTARDRVVGETALLVALVAAVPVVASALVVAGVGPFVELGLSVDRLIAVSVSTWLFGLAFGMAALVVGAHGGRRSRAIAIGVALLAAAYTAEIVGATASWGDWLSELSLFHHLVAVQPVVTGTPWGPVVVTTLISVAAVELASRLLARRDLVG